MSSSLSSSTLSTTSDVSVGGAHSFTYASTPTLTTTQQGYSVTSTTIVNSSFSSSSATTVATITIPVGYWLLSGSMTFSGTGTGVNLRYSTNTSNAVQGIGNPTSSFCNITMFSYCYQNTTASTAVSLQALNNGGSNTVNNVFLTAVRLA